MEILGSAAAAPSKEEILAQVQGELMQLVSNDVRGDTDREKVYQYSQARKYDLYDRGKQYLVPQMVNGEVADWSPVSGTVKDNSNSNGRYDHVIPRLRGDRKKFVAVLGQRAPTVKCMPDRSDDEDAIRISRRADIEARRLFFDWDVERHQRQLACDLWKTGTTFGYTAYVSNAEKYGTVDEPTYDLQDQPTGPGSYHCIQCGADTPDDQAQGTCPSCGAPLTESEHTPAQTTQVPVVSGTQTYAKGAVEFALATVFEVTTPFYVRSIEDLPWLLYEYDEHNGRLLALYPKLRDKLKDDGSFGSGTSAGTGNSAAQGSIARDTAASPTGTLTTGRKNRSLYTRVWLTPLMYELVQDPGIRKLLSENFKTGAKLTIVLSEIVDIEEERIQDHWTYCKPDTSEYIYADPLCADLIGIQDIVNDMHNIAVETAERSIPWFLFDPQVLDPVQMRNHALRPAEGVPAKPGVGQQLQNSIWKAPVSELNAAVGQWTDKLWETGREISGAIPAVFGGSGGPQKTAHQAELDRNQALMQWSLVWAEMRSFWAKAIENGIRLTAKYGAAHGGEEEGEGSQLAGLAELEKGAFHCETEEQMPIPWSQRRDYVMSLLDKSPDAQQKLGLWHPNNLPQVQQIVGMDAWTIPALNNRDKVYKTITELLNSAPVHDPQTGKVEPSIQIDIFEDDHALSAQIIKEWCQSDPGRTAKDTKPDGYANVVAWGMAHFELTMPDPMQGDAGGAGAPPAPAAGPGGPSGAPTGHPPAPQGSNILPFPGQSGLPKLSHPSPIAANGAAQQ